MDQIEGLAYKAWDEFYNQMERYFHRGQGRGNQLWQNRHYKTFRSIAQRCLEARIDVVDFIMTSFTLLQKSTDYLTPKDFDNADAIQRYKHQMETVGSDVKTTWRQQIIELVNIECSMIPKFYEDEVAVLLDARQPFNAWFRVIYPEGFNELLCNKFGQLAWDELRKDRRLRDFLREKRSANMQSLQSRFGQFGDIAGGT